MIEPKSSCVGLLLDPKRAADVSRFNHLRTRLRDQQLKTGDSLAARAVWALSGNPLFVDIQVGRVIVAVWSAN